MFAMRLNIPFDNTYANLDGAFFSRVNPVPVKEPALIAYNAELAKQIGITSGTEQEHTEVFSGTRLAEGSDPLAQLYAGHQFGHYSPQLGDGRAVLLGETCGPDNRRRDIQLKGSGPTPYSRRGDGRAWLGPVLREYLISEAMHALGVPTTRALAAVSTGETVFRESPLPGAVLTRVAASHIRVGTFQVFAARGDVTTLQQLLEYTLNRHYPNADGPLGLLKAVIAAQAQLVAKWMSVGFIHGVMNTDNCQIAGETIDYGPCAFLDHYDPMAVFSSIDRQGRYAFSNQPDIIVWNMAQLATALIPLMPDQEKAIALFTTAVHAMPQLIRDHWNRAYGAKIGLTELRPGDDTLVTQLLQVMADSRADYTNTFRGLITGTARDHLNDTEGFDDWARRWQNRLRDVPDPEAVMARNNPVYIARNHRVEQMITAAVGGDYAPFHRLRKVLAHPYDSQPDSVDLTQPPTPQEVVPATFCGT